ncbi:MAG: substrate-binding domain-containing protein, partial [Pseudomonadota bacterium]
MKTYKLSIIITLFALMPISSYCLEQIRIVGSSTVYPFSASVAEHFGKAGDYKTPIVEATGTGAGLKLFCAGIGSSFPSVTNASRKILDSEIEQCAKNNIKNIIEVNLGYDGIVFASSIKATPINLKRSEIFLALARFVPKDGKIVPNYYTKWQEINPSLPNIDIKVYGTPPVSGTYDTFIELVMKKGCEEINEYSKLIPKKEEREKECKMLREDGFFIQAGENGNLITQKLIGDVGSIGILGFSFLDQNQGKIQAASIEGSSPSFESIQNGAYPISRPLFFYIKGESVAVDSGINEFAQEFMSEGAIF